MIQQRDSLYGEGVREEGNGRKHAGRKRIGDFGEGLVTYAMIRKGFEVSLVDDIGADLIAAGRGQRYAVAVKARLFRHGSKSRVTVVEWEPLRRVASLGAAVPNGPAHGPSGLPR